MNNSIIELFGKKIGITLMNLPDFKEINQWCIDEGWNIGIYDSEIYYKIDPMVIPPFLTDIKNRELSSD